MKTAQATRESFIVVLDANRFVATPEASQASFDGSEEAANWIGNAASIVALFIMSANGK
jgi:hypothetical protein